MQELKINSDKYPAIGLIISDRPTIGGPGSFEFTCGHPYAVSDAVVGEVRQQIAGFREGVRRHLTVEARAIAPAASPAVGAVAAPQRADEAFTEEGEPTPVASSEASTPVEPDVGSLSDDDRELIQIEVDKLLAKDTIAEREPLLVATAGNDDLPKVLRLAYLDALIAHGDVQKGLKAIAQDWRETVEAAG
ncbi:MAG: hypothetical protein O3A14_11420 [Cyanobacteria bacterium]|nr:hypothetical protein [Cyanobacteriota bacterium]